MRSPAIHWRHAGDAFGRHAGDTQEIRSGDTREIRGRYAGDTQEIRRRYVLAQEIRRRYAGDTQEIRRRYAGDTVCKIREIRRRYAGDTVDFMVDFATVLGNTSCRPCCIVCRFMQMVTTLTGSSVGLARIVCRQPSHGLRWHVVISAPCDVLGSLLL